MTALEYKKKMAEISMECMEKMLELTSYHLTQYENVIHPDEIKDQHELTTAELREKVASMDYHVKLAKKAKKMADQS